MRHLLLSCLLMMPLAAENSDEPVEYVSIPKSFLSKLDIELFGSRWGRSESLAPSDELKELLLLSDEEAAALEKHVVTMSDKVVDLTVEYADIAVAQPDHIEFTVRLPDEVIASVETELEDGFTRILGPTRNETLNLLRKSGFSSDKVAATVYGKMWDDGLDRIITVTYKREGPNDWRRRYEQKRRNGFGGGSSSSSGGDLRDHEQQLAQRILKKNADAGDVPEPGAGNAPTDDAAAGAPEGGPVNAPGDADTGAEDTDTNADF